MTRTWLGRAAVRAYPAEVRSGHGEELIGTLLDAGENSVAGFGRELVSVVAGGLAARSRKALSQPIGKLSVDVVRWACIIIVARGLTGDLASLRWGATFGGSLKTVCVMYAGPVLILALFTAGRDRATGIVGLICLYADIHTQPATPGQPLDRALAAAAGRVRADRDHAAPEGRPSPHLNAKEPLATHGLQGALVFRLLLRSGGRLKQQRSPRRRSGDEGALLDQTGPPVSRGVVACV